MNQNGDKKLYLDMLFLLTSSDLVKSTLENSKFKALFGDEKLRVETKICLEKAQAGTYVIWYLPK